jgi:hypothetical protein
LIFFTPELLLEKKWRELFHTKPYMSRVRAFIVYEAHTVKKWCVCVHWGGREGGGEFVCKRYNTETCVKLPFIL